MRSPTSIVTLLVAAMICAPIRITAQCRYCGLPILQLPAGARPLGLGGAYVAGDGPDAVFYNPAQVGAGHGSTVNVARAGGATLGEFATTGSMGPLGVGAGFRFSSRGGAAVTPADQLPGGEMVAVVAAATRTHGIWVGASASFVNADLAESGGGAAFGAGVAARVLGLRVGVSGENIGSDIGAAGLPTTISVGVELPSVSLGTYVDLTGSLAVSRERDGGVFPKGGVEMSYEPVSGWTFTGRVGMRRAPLESGRIPQSALVLGGSFGLDAIAVDYAFSPARGGVPATHSLGLRIQ